MFKMFKAAFKPALSSLAPQAFFKPAPSFVRLAQELLDLVFLTPAASPLLILEYRPWNSHSETPCVDVPPAFINLGWLTGINPNTVLCNLDMLLFPAWFPLSQGPGLQNQSGGTEGIASEGRPCIIQHKHKGKHQPEKGKQVF